MFNTMKFDTTDEDEIIVDETTEADDCEKKNKSNPCMIKIFHLTQKFYLIERLVRRT